LPGNSTGAKLSQQGIFTLSLLRHGGGVGPGDRRLRNVDPVHRRNLGRLACRTRCEGLCGCSLVRSPVPGSRGHYPIFSHTRNRLHYGHRCAQGRSRRALGCRSQRYRICVAGNRRLRLRRRNGQRPAIGQSGKRRQVRAGRARRRRHFVLAPRRGRRRRPAGMRPLRAHAEKRILFRLAGGTASRENSCQGAEVKPRQQPRYLACFTGFPRPAHIDPFLPLARLRVYQHRVSAFRGCIR
jgi:hypothetical protein